MLHPEIAYFDNNRYNVYHVKDGQQKIGIIFYDGEAWRAYSLTKYLGKNIKWIDTWHLFSSKE